MTWSENLNINLSRSQMVSMISLGFLRNIHGDPRSLPCDCGAVVVGAGPSLDKNIYRLKSIPESVEIVATNSAVRGLVLRGIRPHYVVAAEEHRVLSRYLEGIESLTGITLIASSTTHPEYLKKFRDLGGSIYFYNNNSDSLANRWTGNTNVVSDSYEKVSHLPKIDPIAGNITFHGIAIARYLGFKRIAVIGCDLFVDDDRHHDSSYPEGMNSKSTHADFLTTLRRSFSKTLEAAKRVDPTNLTNCTEGGVLDAFPKMKLIEWIEKESLKDVGKESE